MSYLKWEKGRQEGEYKKMLLLPMWFVNFFKIDAYLIYIPEGLGIKKHKDPVEDDHIHYRFNFTLKYPRSYIKRRKMYVEGEYIWKFWRINLFRPDIYYHGVRPLVGSMILLSIGRKKKLKHLAKLLGE